MSSPPVASSNPVVVDIKMSLEMNGGDSFSQQDLIYGTPSVGKMAKTPKIVTPLALFHKSEPDLYDFPEEDESTRSESEISKPDTRIGIARPSYYNGEDDHSLTTDECRIGISPASYDRPQGDLPLSPLSLIKKIDHWNFSPVSVVEHGRNRRSEFWWEESKESAPPTPMLEGYDPSMIDLSQVDTIDRMVHPHTANGHFLVNSTPLSVPPIEGLRYCLSEGMTPQLRKEVSNPRLLMDSAARNASSRRNSLLSPPRLMSFSGSTSSGSSRQLVCSDPFKIFILLLQPKAKIFELIQILYSPSITTVGDILDMIPSNASEPALGNQSYYGLCRPKDGDEIIDMDFMASGPGGEGCARITRGEILLAIPERYTGHQIAKLGRPLLANPKVVQLMKKKDPLSARRPSHRDSSESTPVPALTNEPHTVSDDDESMEQMSSSQHSVNSSISGATGADERSRSSSQRSLSSLSKVDLASMSLDERLQYLRRRSLKRVTDEPFEDVD